MNINVYIQTLAYDSLLEQLDLKSIRELEDFLINECIYTEMLNGKLDQQSRCLEVRSAISRDIKKEDVDSMIDVFGHW